MIERSAFERLIEKGRRRGGLSAEDLRAALPIERMSADDIAMVVLQIEEEGVQVELDDELLARSGALARTLPPSVPVLDLPEAREPRREEAQPKQSPAPSQATAALRPTGPVTDLAPSPRSSWALIIIAAGLVAVLAFVALMLSR